MQVSYRDRFILERIIRHCEEITETMVHFGDNYKLFISNPVYRNACALPVLQIGELCGHLSAEFRIEYSGIPWRAIIGMRNIVVHAYGKVSPATLWETLHCDVPGLRSFCDMILESK